VSSSSQQYPSSGGEKKGTEQKDRGRQLFKQKGRSKIFSIHKKDRKKKKSGKKKKKLMGDKFANGAGSGEKTIGKTTPKNEPPKGIEWYDL